MQWHYPILHYSLNYSDYLCYSLLSVEKKYVPHCPFSGLVEKNAVRRRSSSALGGKGGARLPQCRGPCRRGPWSLGTSENTVSRWVTIFRYSYRDSNLCTLLHHHQVILRVLCTTQVRTTSRITAKPSIQPFLYEKQSTMGKRQNVLRIKFQEKHWKKFV